MKASNQLLERAEKFRDEIDEKQRHYHDKWNRARKYESQNAYYKKYSVYRDILLRAIKLVSRLRRPPINHYEWEREWERGAYHTRLQRKEERRQDFLNKHRYSIWFLQARLSADYGQFRCDRCSRIFYHSPSTITKAAKEIIHCSCGSCTNDIISQDWGECPYQ